MFPESSQNPDKRISSTACVIAYRRTFTDIPFSQDIFQELKNRGEKAISEFKIPSVAPQIEARHKLINRLIQETGIKQIFEIAAGLSPRGLEMTDDSTITYVESDLEEISSQKKSIVKTLEEKSVFSKRPNLHIEIANALDINSWQTGISHLNQEKPIIVVNEGLLRYFNFDQKTIVAKNIHALLKTFGGFWITSDISLKKIILSENNATTKQSEKVKKTTKINTAENCFNDVDDAQNFFKNLGFKIESHSFMEVINQLVSPQRLNQPKEDVEALLKDPVVFVMRVI